MRHGPVADWLSLGIVTLLLMVAGLTLYSADWVDHLVVIPAIGVLGVLAGAALAISRFTGRRASFFALFYGLFVVGWQIGRVLEGDRVWADRLAELARRIAEYLAVLVRGESNPDLMMFVVLMGLVFWAIGCVASWAMFRHASLWPAVLLPGIAVAVNAFYYRGTLALNWYLAVYVLLALLLVLRSNLLGRRSIWRAVRATVAPGAGNPIGQSGVLVAVLLVSAAWVGPAFARSEAAADLWNGISRPWLRLRERIGDAFGQLRGPTLVVADSFGSLFPLGAGEEPADSSVMEVAPGRLAPRGTRFYWRARVYDHYEGGAWTSTPMETAAFDPGDGDLPQPEYAGREVIGFEFTVRAQALRTLNVPAQPIWVDRPAVILREPLPGGGVDVASVAAGTLVTRGEVYQARASVAVPNADDLRAAGADYPGWVIDRYLQVPPEITERTRALAVSLTESAQTPYDAVTAITRWLRSNLRYSRVTEPPPEGSEPIDWVLFEYQTAFCNYYASAEIILLRSLGIPARLAVGYATGRPMAGGQAFEVRGVDAHAWPEVFFPGYGWIEFEPTSAQPALERPRSPTEAGDEGEPGPLEGAADFPFQEDRIDQEFFPGQGSVDESEPAPLPAPVAPPARTGWVVVLAALGVSAVVALWLWIDPYAQAVTFATLAQRLREAGLEPPPRLARTRPRPKTLAGQIYLRWSLWLERLGITLAPSQTPYERAAAFSQRMLAGSEAAWAIVTAYAQERYGGLTVDPSTVQHAWKSLRTSMWSGWFGRLAEPLRERTRGPVSGAARRP